MFTGIVTDLGTVAAIDRTRPVTGVSISAPSTARGLAVGDSVAVNGVCLTVVDVDRETFTVEVVPETLSRSALGDLRDGDPVNLERPLAADGRLDGHVVQGHVDGVGAIVALSDEGGSTRVRIAIPSELSSYVVEKGSIAVDGTSLTLTAVSPAGATSPWCEFVLIPHTLGATTFHARGPGDRVNVEVDILAKYVERMMGGTP
jgi:riboflavin synthase